MNLSRQLAVALGLLVLSTPAFSRGSPPPKKPVPVPVQVEVPAPAPVTPVPSLPTQTPNAGHVGEGSTYTNPLKVFPSASGYFTAKIKTESCDATQNAKVAEAEKIIVTIFNSEEFKKEVLNFQYNGKTQFNWNEGMTNEQIYNHFMKGAEALQPLIDYEMDIVMVCYFKSNSTVGYTYPSVMKIYANMKFHSKYTAVEVASNTAHEWTHKMGFDHAAKWSSPRDFTVPYGMNKIIKKLGPLAQAGKLTPLKPQ